MSLSFLCRYKECKKAIPFNKIIRCPTCYTPTYCSRKCMHDDLPRHKNTCKKAEDQKEIDDGVINFLRSFNAILFESSTKKFKESGRGIMIVNIEKYTLSELLVFEYFKVNHIDDLKIHSSMRIKLAEMIHNYKPSTQYVVGFTMGENELFSVKTCGIIISK